jgi:hypothetical protein
MQRRLGQAEVGHVEQRLGRDIRCRPGQYQVVGQVEVLHVWRRLNGHAAS